MTFFYRSPGVAKGHLKVTLPGCVLWVVASSFSAGAWAQGCPATTQGMCKTPGAACQSGSLHGYCSSSGPKGDRECDCKTLPPPPVTCATLNVCPANAPLSNRLFYIHDLGAKGFGTRCVDAGLPASWAENSPVVINACDKVAFGQQIRVSEIDNNHDVGLSVAMPLTNASTPAVATHGGGQTPFHFCIGVREGKVGPGAPLVLQPCNAASPAQRFALDGDAILAGSQASGNVTREFAVAREQGFTTPGTSLVLSTRDPTEDDPSRMDAQYFRFEAVDQSGAAPTSGFLTVSDEQHLACAAENCSWGTVVQIDDAQPLVLTGKLIPIYILDGITIRGYRTETYQGPEVRTCFTTDDWNAFLTSGDDVRITGFRLHGAEQDPRCSPVVPETNDDSGPRGVLVTLKSPTTKVWLDHLEIAHWTNTAIGNGGTTDAEMRCPLPPPGPPQPPAPYPREVGVHVIGNFFFHNLYASVSGGDTFALNRANVTWYMHYQSLSGGRDIWQGHADMDNLFLSDALDNDVDMHGTGGSANKHFAGGVAGDYFDVGFNTFLDTGNAKDNYNINQRGASCRPTRTSYHDNIFRRAEKDAINKEYEKNPIEYGNTFNAADPTLQALAVGDFDGDGLDDVFLTTGETWYYSSGGQAEWRYLNRMSDTVSNLLFGDFDGDGRTDVLAVHGGGIDVSWAGVSAWQTINVVAWPVSDLAVGDFDGDGRSDLLLATGTQWFFASGGRNWQPFVGYPDRISDLRFGHFTKTNKTQILRVHNHHWEIAEWGTPAWADLGPAPVDSISGLFPGVFNADGYTDLAQVIPFSLGNGQVLYDVRYTSPGHNTSWTDVGEYATAPIGVGRFEGGTQTDLLMWSDKHFYYAGKGQNTPQSLSRQVMR